MNVLLVLILFVLISSCVLEGIVNYLNFRHMKPFVPREVEGYYDPERYNRARDYLKDRSFFAVTKRCVLTLLSIFFILAGGFNIVDRMARAAVSGSVLAGLLFAGILILIFSVIMMPFSVWETFVIERKYGFNRTSVLTFVLDVIKGMLLTICFGGIVFAGAIWIFENLGALAWLYCWAVVVLFQIIISFIAPIVILPLFNRFVPLEHGELKTAVEAYAKQHSFQMSGIFTMDGSRRSTKSNAMFTGFGRYRRIVLFDTLIRKYSVDELVCVLAHEVGHYKKNHILKLMGISFLVSGLLFYVVSLLLGYDPLFDAFKIDQPSIYSGLVIAAFIFLPVDFLISIIVNWISRKYEFEADAYAVQTTGKHESMISALKSLSVDHLANLTPHPLKVFVNYTHPPVLQRIKLLKQDASRSD